MASRACEVCGGPYEAARSSARYCSARCAKRAQRQGKARPREAAAAAREGDLHEATLAELQAVGREDSALGVAALKLAAGVDAAGDMGVGVAVVVKEWRATLAAATVGVDIATPLDELRSKREQRLTG